MSDEVMNFTADVEIRIPAKLTFKKGISVAEACERARLMLPSSFSGNSDVKLEVSGFKRVVLEGHPEPDEKYWEWHDKRFTNGK